MIAPNIEYFVPVAVYREGEDLHGFLTVARRADGRFWEAKLHVHPTLCLTMEQVATPKNGGFFHMTDADFLEQVRTVFGFAGGAHFDFVSDDFAPLSANLVDFGGDSRSLH